MDLDDFLVPSSIGTPAGMSPEASTLPNDSLASTGSTISAIPIKQGQRSEAEELQISRASAPSISAFEQVRPNQEFGYVPRHVRKTSIDERRVCIRESLLSRLYPLLTTSATETKSRSVASSTTSHQQQHCAPKRRRRSGVPQLHS